MRIQKKDDGSFEITCCAEEVHFIHACMTLMVRTVKDYHDKLSILARKLGEHMCKTIEPIATIRNMENMEERGCFDCASLFEDGHPQCKGWQHEN